MGTNQIVANVTDFSKNIQKGRDNIPGMKGVYRFNPALIGAIAGSITLPIYFIDIVLNNEVVFTNWAVMGSKIGEQGIDVLIGMDIISKGDFTISNYNGKAQFSFRIPSQNDVDYKAES